MTINIPTKGDDTYQRYALYLHSKGINTGEAVLDYMKSINYTVKLSTGLTKFDAICLANIVTGINLGLALSKPKTVKSRTKVPK